MPEIPNTINLFIISPSFAGGGAERVALNLANHYGDMGINVCLVLFNGVGPLYKQVGESVRLIDLKASSRLEAYFRLKRVLKQETPSHILSAMRDTSVIAGLVVPKSRQWAFICREANTMQAVSRLPFLKRLLFKTLMKHAYQKADRVIANSTDTKKDLVAENIVEKRKVTVISNPVIDERFTKNVAEPVEHRWLRNAGPHKTVLNVGRLHPQKNQMLLLRAFAIVLEKLPSTKLIILGEGAEHKKLSEYLEANAMSDSVDLIPFQDNPYPFYRACDLFVLSSDWEGFGNILVESLACGTPVISTDCPGGPRAILDNGEFGVLVPCGNAESLASAILENLENPEKWPSAALKERGKQYTVKAIASEYLDCIVGERS